MCCEEIFRWTDPSPTRFLPKPLKLFIVSDLLEPEHARGPDM